MVIAFNESGGEMHAELSFYEHHLHLGKALEIIQQYRQILHDLSVGRITTLADAGVFNSVTEAYCI